LLRNICIYSKRKYCVKRLLVYVMYKTLLDLSRCTGVSVSTICISKEDSTTKARVVSCSANYIPLTNSQHLSATRALCPACHSKLVEVDPPETSPTTQGQAHEKLRLHRPIYADKLVPSYRKCNSFDSFSHIRQGS
jgi:hypothetical protein